MKKRKTYNQPKQVNGKTPQQKRNQIYAYILAFAMVFWTIASVLGIIGFARGFEVDTPSASAQGYAVNGVKSAVVHQSFDTDEFEVDLGFKGATVITDTIGEEAFSLSTLVFKGNSNGNYIVLDGISFPISSGDTFERNFAYRFYSSGGAYNSDDTLFISYYDNRDEDEGNPLIYIKPDVNGDGCYPESVVLESIISVDTFGSFRYVFTFDWTDIHGISTDYTSVLTVQFNYSIPYGIQDIPLFYPFFGYWNTFDTMTSRTIFIGNASSVYVGAWYEYAYVLGKDVSYGSGFDEGYADGLNEGYTNGYDVGRQDGYIQGVAEANEYSFNGLFSSIFDVPVQTFTSLFSFDILGVDLSGLFFSILTVGIILAVVKWLIP